MPGLALAHIGQGDVSGGFLAGLEHPVLGLDHVVAMVSVGIWGAQLRQPAIWVLPVTFPIVMSFGGILGGLGVPIPGIEIGIALSAIVLGSMIALEARPPLWVAGVIVGIFAIFHGYAHGAELPESANAISYAMGFVIATGSLHALGILVGVINKWPAGAKVLRVGGVAVALCGVYFLVAHFMNA
ncbi:MAG TPA: HupE/UreJ family protein [Burkholderiales bacterium]|nr:HupE/UreJ family protein [Burkholderiales bacterium]